MEPLSHTGLSLAVSLATRKRDGDALDLLERPDGPKRRMTPVPGLDPLRDSSPFSSSDSGVAVSVDILDLTGLDVDADSTDIAQLMENELIEKERSSKQDKLTPENEEPPASGQEMASAVRISKDTPQGNLPTSIAVPSQRPQAMGHPQSNGQPPQPPSGANRVPEHLMPNPARGMNYGASMPPTGLTFNPSIPNSNGLADIINKTRMLDYAMGVDEFGRPLPARLQDYLADTYYDPAVSERDLNDLLRNIQPDGVNPKVKTDTPEGLKMTLYPHQALALTWMKSMEDGTNKGGILADDMGLGKTVSTIALLLSRPATSKAKTNLIIGPLSLIRQWEEEITAKIQASHHLSVFIYHNKKATTDDLMKYDVVLTTYGIIAQEQKRLEEYDNVEEARRVALDDASLRNRFPLLHPGKAAFHRVILDEAQFIKNERTRAAKACHRVKATFRWCLTGTPMMNGVIELFSLVRFLRIRPYANWTEFRSTFGPLFGKSDHSKHVAMSRLRALLKAIMLRRKKDSKINDRPILQLPEKTEEVVYADLSQDERDYYNQLEKSSQVQFNKYLRDGGIGKNYSSILVLLLRLRQACCHPHLNLDVDDAADLMSTEEQMMQLVTNLASTIVTRIKCANVLECPICYDLTQSPKFFPCGHMSCSQCLTTLVDGARAVNLRNGVDSDMAKCPVCRASFVMKDCFTYRAFQKVHMPESILARKKEEEEDKGKSGEVKKEIKREDKRVDIKPSMLRALRKQASQSRQAYEDYMAYLRQTWLPAAKVSQCIKLLQQAMEDGEKVIVFSQWTLLLDLIQVGLSFEDELKPESGNEFRRYDGGMSSDQRFTAARDFRDVKSVKIMLVSLRAGNAGLNLTAASRVIIMDPFWNPYIERQAIDRAHRIGQEKNVRVYRILTKDTVEDRIVELKERKEVMVEAALDEAEGMKISRLGEAQLKFLFNTRR